MDKIWWDELVAQVDASNGPDAIVFIADDGNYGDENKELDVQDVRFENDRIEVRLA